MTQATFLSRFAIGAGAAVIIGTAALAQTSPPAPPSAASAPAAPPPAASAPAAPAASPYPPTATITTPGYPGVGPADSKLRVVGVPGGKKVHLLPATLETTQWGWFDNAQPPVLRLHSG